MSPSSSPRLPSPPPMAEDQIGPLSPTAAMSEDKGKLGGFSNVDQGASRRIRPGTKAADMAEGPPLVELSEIDSAFQLTEHLKALYNSHTHPVDSNSIIPIDRQTAIRLADPPDGVDRALWLYELCRFLTQKANSIVVELFADSPPCSAQTCPEMRASEWQYLCAVHDPPKSCCAIDYCCHTLDWAANTLTSPKHFPSRLALGTEANTPQQQIRQLTNIFRRVYRIFAHAWFQHRDMFWRIEGRTGLYVLFKTVCDEYNLIPEDNYTIPSEAEGMQSTPVASDQPTFIRRTEFLQSENERGGDLPVAEKSTTATGNTTKRHRQTPSVGANAVSTVPEENEEEEQPAQLEAPREDEPPAYEEPSDEAQTGEVERDGPLEPHPESSTTAVETPSTTASEEAVPEGPAQSSEEQETVAAEDRQQETNAQEEQPPEEPSPTTAPLLSAGTTAKPESETEAGEQSEEDKKHEELSSPETQDQPQTTDPMEPTAPAADASEASKSVDD
ncbi:hypothetical protein W97_07491 [Coniosporium apollinis CBS 100218]|uniref:Mob1/phocein n=1 Tax=Coniosporium apollinis (strain CBS 100218) TaxID=1168221 RepID=R7Z2B4_CONA1|nr:uncharacterized protein W97_07491 [Coniosporium apollinis CBS 100218]EON68233.1 hypothetical protein W97_07491 [Coniosporium apollinis CBS 100218]